MRRGLRALRTWLTVAAAYLTCAGPVLAADVVEYYHTDGIGNVRAVTNQAGQVIERHDYLPFGEECITGACASNPGLGAGQPRKFTGKERDAETGLDYFGARYYSAKTARFTTIDPVYTWRENLVDPQRWNRYAYALNNPFRYIDVDGRWPTKLGYTVHQNSIDRTLAFLPQADREVLGAQQLTADEDQSSGGAPRHAMRAPNQTIADATKEANDYIRAELGAAIASEKDGAHVNALAHLGNAMHTLQDATSPTHEGFQVWDEHWQSAWSKEGRQHVRGELHDPGEASALDRATARAYQYFTGARKLPEDFFQDR